MKESKIVVEFKKWKKLYDYLNLEKEGYSFSNLELEEIFELLDILLLKNRSKIEDCVKLYGIQRVMTHQC